MLFDRDIPPSCTYCRFGRALGSDEIACVKRGIEDVSGFCGAFNYEPTKRIPRRMPKINTSMFTEEDFSL